jgi:hypothetical protein
MVEEEMAQYGEMTILCSRTALSTLGIIFYPEDGGSRFLRNVRY